MRLRVSVIATAVPVLLLVPAAAGTQESGPAGQVRALNRRVLELHADALKAPAVRAQAASAIRARSAALAALVERDPGAALALAFSEDLLARLAADVPEAAPTLESRGEWEGTAEYLIFDDAALATHRSLIRIRTAEGLLEVHFAGVTPALKCGDRLRVRGVRAGGRVAAADGSIVGTALAATACTPAGPQNTAVLLVTFPGVAAPGITAQTVWDIFFGVSGRSVSNFWYEASYGQTTATGDVFGWYTLDAAYTCDEYHAMRDAAIRAADPYVDFTKYNRVFIIFPNPGSCGWAGLSTVGCGGLTTGDGSITASTSWLLATYMSSRDQGVKLATHEGGHGLGLAHASSRDFGAETLGPPGETGTLSEYGDSFSTMGYWNFGHYAAPHKRRLSWLADGPNILTVESSGRYTLQPIETSPAGVQALKVRRGTGNNAWLWIEYRQPLGLYDSAIGAQPFSGALIHYEDSITGGRTHLLDFTAATSSFSDPALPAGATWVDPYSNLSLSVSSATPSVLAVDVSYGPVPCVTAAPGVEVSPSNPTVSAGAAVSYTVTVTNRDSAGCPASTLGLASAAPDGWPSSFDPASLTLAPGETGSAILTKTAPAGAAPGTYEFTVSAGSGWAAANCTVAAPLAPLSADLSLGVTLASARQSVPIALAAKVGTAPASGAVAVFTVTRPDGSKATRKVTADAAGNAAWTYRVGPKDPPGPYPVAASVAAGGQTASAGPVSFTVQ